MKRILLVLPSITYRTHAFMQAAERLGLEIVVASDHRQAMAPLVPENSMALNFREAGHIREAVKFFHQRRPLDAIAGVDDLSVYVAGIASECLGLPHNPPESLMAARNKFLMRNKMQESGLPVPVFRKVALGEITSRAAAQIGFPCVVKPLALSGSRGVIRVDDNAAFVKAVESIEKILALPEASGKLFADEKTHILVEQYIPGIEVAVEGIMAGGQLESLAIFDKPDALEGPYFVETIYSTPSMLPGYVQLEVIHAAGAAARALGITHGPVHAEIRVNQDGAWVIEIAARSIGGLCSRALRFNGGASLEEIILRQSVGEDVSGVRRERQAAAVMMVPIPGKGILEGVDGVDSAAEIPSIEEIIISIPVGQELLPLPEGGRYLGFIFARGDEPAEVLRDIREAHRLLKINIRS